MHKARALMGAVLAAMILAVPALAVEPDEILADPALEARARDISAGLRCLVCQNQSIDDSNAPLARDLRLLVRERLKAGDTNAQVLQFVEDRYGEFVLLRPPFDARTLILWLAPLLVLLSAIVVVVRIFRPRSAPAAVGAPLSSGEEARLHAILADNDGKSSSKKKT